MYTFANALLTKLNACNAVTITERNCEEYYVTVDLGTGYNNIDWDGGYWADVVRITDERLELVFSVYGNGAEWDEDADYSIGEGMVHMHYADFGSGNLAYTSELENAVNEAVQTATNGILVSDGSEQGMQGYDAEDDCYLSLDVYETA